MLERDLGFARRVILDRVLEFKEGGVPLDLLERGAMLVQVKFISFRLT